MKVVTFDFWDTLIHRDSARSRDRRREAWVGVLGAEGIEVDPERLLAAMHHAAARFDAEWRENRYYGAAAAADDMLDQLGAKVGPGVRADLVAAIGDADPDPDDLPPPTDHVAVALEGLRSRGIRIGIICDVGLTPSTTLRRYLELHGLLGYFDHWSFSDEVGTFKPDPAIFAHALEGLGGADPTDGAHVGDLRRTDVAGAQAVGMRAVRYRGAFDDPGHPDDGSDQVEGDVVIDDHADLVAALDLA